MKPASIDPPEVWPTLWRDVTGNIGWDIGANCGQTIPVMLNNFYKVIAFEPAEECHPYLARFVGSITWLPLAITDQDGPVDLVALPDKIDTGQLVTAGTPGMEWNPDSPDAVTRTVVGRSVDSLLTEGLLDTPDFMKIDVEGHELKVLFGAKKTLAMHRPQLLVEFHSKGLHASVKRLLETYGYSCFTIRHPHYTPGSDLWYGHGWIRATQTE